METSLISAPVYPSAVKWSKENLIAVAAGHLVTIFNPALLRGPRGFVACKQCPCFEFGILPSPAVAQKSLVATRLDKDPKVSARSIDWSPRGLANHGGCLLAVCTTDGRAKLYRAPYDEYQAEWIEVLDVSDLILAFHKSTAFHLVETLTKVYEKDDTVPEPSASWGDMALSGSRRGRPPSNAQGTGGGASTSAGDAASELSHKSIKAYARNRKVQLADGAEDEEEVVAEEAIVGKEGERKRGGRRGGGGRGTGRGGRGRGKRKSHALTELLDETEDVSMAATKASLPLTDTAEESKGVEEEVASATLTSPAASTSLHASSPPSPSSSLLQPTAFTQHAASFFLGKNSPQSRVLLSSPHWAVRHDAVSCTAVAWSPHPCAQLAGQRGALLALGSKSGHISVVHCAPSASLALTHCVPAHLGAWVTALAWCCSCGRSSSHGRQQQHHLLLLSGASDGSVRLWSSSPPPPTVPTPTGSSSSSSTSAFDLTLLHEVQAPDGVPVTAVALSLATSYSSFVLVSAGKASGQLLAKAVSLEEEEEEGGRGFSSSPPPPRAPLLAVVAHCQAVTGLLWDPHVRCLYSCAQDNELLCWHWTPLSLHKSSLPPQPAAHTAAANGGSGMSDMSSHGSTAEANGANVDSFLGLAASPNGLLLAAVRGVAQNVHDSMYMKKTSMGTLQLTWIAGQREEEPQTQSLGTSHDAADVDHLQYSRHGMQVKDWEAWKQRLSNILSSAFSSHALLTMWDLTKALKVSDVAFDGLELVLGLVGLPVVAAARSGRGREVEVEESLDGMLQISTSAALQVTCVLIRQLGLQSHSHPTHSGIISSARSAKSKAAHGSKRWGDYQNGLEHVLRLLENELFQRYLLKSLRCSNTVQNGLSGPLALSAQLQASWVLQHSRNVWPSLKEEAERMSEGLSNEESSDAKESCFLCNAFVPMESAEWAVCSGFSKHKLHRCMNSMLVCKSAKSLHCLSCQRWVSPEISTRIVTEGWERRDTFQVQTGNDYRIEDLVQYCLFCRIPVQRTLPITQLIPVWV